VNNYLTFIYNSQLLKTAPASWQDLLDSRFKNKLQYSTPGQAGDGTAVMLQAFHSMAAKRPGSIISVSCRPITLARRPPPVS
jgi:2-aminoethylphosphonate transport system substrate-binding protein